jgi:hypothetical protein
MERMWDGAFKSLFLPGTHPFGSQSAIINRSINLLWKRSGEQRDSVGSQRWNFRFKCKSKQGKKKRKKFTWKNSKLLK